MPNEVNWFRNSAISHETPDVKRPGYADLSQTMPLGVSMSEAEFRRGLSAAIPIDETDNASLAAAMYSLRASGTVKWRRVGMDSFYTLVRRWGPIAPEPNFHSFDSTDDDDSGAGGDAAYRRAKRAEQSREDARTRSLIDERLRAHGLI